MTIDSFAGHLCQIVRNECDISFESASYDENILNAIKLIEGFGLGEATSCIRSFLKEEIDLIVFDECQDINDQRLNLAKKIIYSLDESCKILILGDPLQAIYEFSADNKDEDLLQWSEETKAFEFLNIQLKHNHRVKNNELSMLNQKLRDIYYKNKGHMPKAFTEFNKAVEAFTINLDRSNLKQTILFRRNYDALEYYLSIIRSSSNKHPALRLGSFKNSFHPGIAFLASFANTEGIASHDHIWGMENIENIEKHLQLDEFSNLFDPIDKLCGNKNNLNISDLYNLSLKSQIPSQFNIDHIGNYKYGAVSSIHSFKGLEDENVVMHLPNKNPLTSRKNIEFIMSERREQHHNLR